MTIKQVIQEAGRWEDCMQVLMELACRNFIEIPVRVYSDVNGKANFRVRMESVRTGMRIWFDEINKECVERKGDRFLDVFQKAIDTDREYMMLNYTNALSHRETPDENELEIIRTLQIISLSIDYINCQLYIDNETGEYLDYDIPKGWKKEEKKCEN